MPVTAIGAERLVDGEPIVDVPPVVGRCIGRVDADCFDRVDGVLHLIDLRRAENSEQDFAAGPHEGQCLVCLAGRHGAHDVDAGNDRVGVVCRPSRKSEDAARRKADDATMAVEAPVLCDPTEAYPVLDALLAPCQFDNGVTGGKARRHARPPACPSLGSSGVGDGQKPVSRGCACHPRGGAAR